MENVTFTSDSVNVIRCIDCIHCHLLNDGISFECTEWEHDFYSPYYDSSTYFCASAQRRS